MEKKGSLVINQTMLLVLAMVVLAILVAFYMFLGDRAESIVRSALSFPSVGGE